MTAPERARPPARVAVGLAAALVVVWFPVAYLLFVPVFALARLALPEAVALVVASTLGPAIAAIACTAAGRALWRQFRR